jgi:hypothetical protein
MSEKLARFFIRHGTARRTPATMMVWDRKDKAPAIINGRLAVGLTPEQAAQILEDLNRFYPEDA